MKHCDLCTRPADLRHTCGALVCASHAVELGPLHCPVCGETWLDCLDLLEVA